MGLMQQQAQKSTDMLPALIQLPFASQHHQQEQQQSRAVMGVAPSPDINAHLKQEGGSQKMVITTLVIPTSTDGTLSQATATQILQDTSSATTTETEQSMKQSHIQVLVMPPSSTVSVTTSPQQVVSSSSLQESIIHSLKNKLTSNVMNFCIPHNMQNQTQNQVDFRDMNNAESRSFQQTAFPLSTASSYASLPKEVHTIQDLLLQSSVKSSLFDSNPGMNGKIPETNSQSGILGSSSLQSQLGSSLENIPLQSLIQTNGNDNLQGPNVQQSKENNLEFSNFVINPNGSANYSSIDQKGTNYSNLLSKSTTDTVFHTEQSIIKNEPKESDVIKTSSGFEMPFNSVMLNSKSANSLNAGDIVQEQKNGHSLLQNENSLSASTSFGGTIGSFFSQQNDASQSSQHAFDQTTIPNPILANALAGVNVSQSENTRDLKSLTENVPISLVSENIYQMPSLTTLAPSLGKSISNSESQVLARDLKSFTDNVQISLASENIYQMTSISTLAPSLGKSISNSESQVLNITNTFPTSNMTTNNLDAVTTAIANSSSLNFNDNFNLSLSKPLTNTTTGTSFSIQDSFLTKCFNKDLMTSSVNKQAVSDSEIKFDQRLLNKDSSTDIILNTSLLASQNIKPMTSSLPLEEKFQGKSTHNDMTFATNDQVTLSIQDLNTISRDANAVNFQNIKTQLCGEATFMGNSSGTINFQDLQERLNVASTMSEPHYQPSTTIASIQDLHSNMLTSVAISNSSNQQILLQGKKMPNESTVADNSLSFTPSTSGGIGMPDLVSISDVYNLSERIKTGDNMSFERSQSLDVTKLDQSLQESYSSESLSSLNSVHDAVDNFKSSSQSINKLPDTSTIQIGHKNMEVVSAIQEALSLQNITQMNTSQEDSSFKTTSQSLEMASNSSLATDTPGQKGMASFSSTQNMPILPGKMIQETFCNQNIESCNVSFTTNTNSISVPSDASVRETYSQSSFAQEEGVSFTTSSQESFKSRSLGNESSTQEIIITFPSKVEGSSTESTLIGFDQQKLGTPISCSQVPTTTFSTTSNVQCVATSGTQSRSAGGPSMEQMSTMMSMLPDVELLKIINPSTFD